MKLLIFVIFLVKFSISQNIEWPSDDPRWNEIPNWWDEKNFNPPIGPVNENNQKFWIDKGQDILKKKLSQRFNFNKAKNLVIFIGDGMGLSTQSATRSFIGDDSVELSFEKFPFSGLSKTYCVNYKTGDSSCTASALLNGVKINYQTVNVEASVRLRNCSAQQNLQTHIEPMIFKYAQRAGKSTGIVTNTRVTHATPAAAYAISASRDWESNAPENCNDIAYQLIHGEIGSKINVILGGGRRQFYPNTTLINGQFGLRQDNRNLLDEYKNSQNLRRNRFSLISNRVS
jgi:alkaline phosphatase